MFKRCCTCRAEKPIADFYPSQPRCKQCFRKYYSNPTAKAKQKAQKRKEYLRNRESVIAKAKLWRSQNRERYRSWQKQYTKLNATKHREFQLRRNYGISIAQYESILLKQNNRCAACGTKTPGGRGVFMVDHCHLSGSIRGLLCRSCNLAAGLLSDSVVNAIGLAVYLFENGSIEEFADCPPILDQSKKESLSKLMAL